MNLKFLFVLCLAFTIFNENLYALICYNSTKSRTTEKCSGLNALCVTIKCGKHVEAKCCTNNPNVLCNYNRKDCQKKCKMNSEPNVEDPIRPKPPCPDIDSCSNDRCNKK
ncbi:hypothetical protein ACQ4LE_001004 [Meloidogyne hapla]